MCTWCGGGDLFLCVCTQCVVGRVQLLVLVVPPYIGRKCSRKAEEIHH